MTAPAEAGVGGLAEGAGVSTKIVMESLMGSFGTVGRAMLPVIAVAALLALAAVVVWFGRRVRAEIRDGRSGIDPRPLVDPSTSDVLGEW